VVWRLDRLGRSLRHLVETVNALAERGVAFASLHEGIDTTTSTGRLIFHIFAALAEFERELIAERAAVGRQAARARGRLGGRPAKLSPEQVKLARARYEARDVTVAEIAKALGVGRGTIYRVLQKVRQAWSRSSANPTIPGVASAATALVTLRAPCGVSGQSARHGRNFHSPLGRAG